MKAKFYIYRNLHTGGFSIKHHGIVIDHVQAFIAHDVELKVNVGGKKRAVESKTRNVHAYLVCDYYHETERVVNGDEITYNPFNDNSFVMCESRKPIYHADCMFGKDGKYI